MECGKRSWWGAHVMRMVATRVAPLLMQMQGVPASGDLVALCLLCFGAEETFALS